MGDNHEDRFRQHEAIMEGLARMLAAQHEMHPRLAACVARQDTINDGGRSDRV
jgi:hypothetical protein